MKQVLAISMIAMMLFGTFAFAQEDSKEEKPYNEFEQSSEATQVTQSNSTQNSTNQTNSTPTQANTSGNNTGNTTQSNSTNQTQNSVNQTPNNQTNSTPTNDTNQNPANHTSSNQTLTNNQTNNQSIENNQTNQTNQPVNSTPNKTDDEGKKKNKTGDDFLGILDKFFNNSTSENTTTINKTNATVVVANETKVNQTNEAVNEPASSTSGSATNHEFKEDLSDDHSIILVKKEATAREPEKSVPVKVGVLLKKPENLPSAPGFVYQYLMMTSPENNGDYTIRFKVSKEWMNKNYISEDSIQMYRFNTQWSKIETTKVNEDIQYIYYQAETPGFSYFAISGEKKVADSTVGKWALITMISITAATAYVYKKVNHGFV